MLLSWILFGFVGWICLMILRGIADGKPKGIPFSSYATGFLFAILLGPLTFLFLVAGLYEFYRRGKNG